MKLQHPPTIFCVQQATIPPPLPVSKRKGVVVVEGKTSLRDLNTPVGFRPSNKEKEEEEEERLDATSSPPSSFFGVAERGEIPPPPPPPSHLGSLCEHDGKERNLGRRRRRRSKLFKKLPKPKGRTGGPHNLSPPFLHFLLSLLEAGERSHFKFFSEDEWQKWRKSPPG